MSDARAMIAGTYRNVPNPAIPIPAFDVPYAAPTVDITIYVHPQLRHNDQVQCLAYCTCYASEAGGGRSALICCDSDPCSPEEGGPWWTELG